MSIIDRLRDQLERPMTNDWIKSHQRYWSRQMGRIRQRAQDKAARVRRTESGEQPQTKKEKP
jgi:hypothetical protein